MRRRRDHRCEPIRPRGILVVSGRRWWGPQTTPVDVRTNFTIQKGEVRISEAVGQYFAGGGDRRMSCRVFGGTCTSIGAVSWFWLPGFYCDNATESDNGFRPIGSDSAYPDLIGSNWRGRRTPGRRRCDARLPTITRFRQWRSPVCRRLHTTTIHSRPTVTDSVGPPMPSIPSCSSDRPGVLLGVAESSV